MKEGKRRLTDLQKKQIVADYIECGNKRQVAEKWDISETYMGMLVSRQRHSVVAQLEAKKEENTLTTLEYMETQHQTKKRILDKLLRGIEIKADDINMLTNVKDLATAYGIILDKELKILELKRGMGNKEDLQKVEELLDKLNIEAYNDTK